MLFAFLTKLYHTVQTPLTGFLPSRQLWETCVSGQWGTGSVLRTGATTPRPLSATTNQCCSSTHSVLISDDCWCVEFAIVETRHSSYSVPFRTSSEPSSSDSSFRLWTRYVPDSNGLLDYVPRFRGGDVM